MTASIPHFKRSFKRLINSFNQLDAPDLVDQPHATTHNLHRDGLIASTNAAEQPAVAFVPIAA